VLERDASLACFEAVTNHVAADEVDGYLVYRRLPSALNLYRTLGIYQRDLETFDEQPVLENRHFGNGCLNCHTFSRTDRTHGAAHPGGGGREPDGCSSGRTRSPRWPGRRAIFPGIRVGRLLAFSANKLSLFFHTTAKPATCSTRTPTSASTAWTRTPS